MIWYFLVLIVSLVLAFAFLFGVAYVRSKFDKYQENSIIELFMDFPKTCISIIFIFLFIGTYNVKYQLHEMWTCSIRSASQNVSTKYSWYFDSCRFQNKDGVWIDIDKVRGTPGSEDDHTN